MKEFKNFQQPESTEVSTITKTSDKTTEVSNQTKEDNLQSNSSNTKAVTTKAVILITAIIELLSILLSKFDDIRLLLGGLQ